MLLFDLSVSGFVRPMANGWHSRAYEWQKR